MRTPQFTALISLFTAILLVILTAQWKDAAPTARTLQWLDETDVQLFHHGLLHRHDVDIRINGVEVVRGYSLSDCDGLLLVAQLPNTAQGLHHVAPGVELSKFEMRYVFEGEIYETPPTLPRLRSWLIDTLPGPVESRELVVGVAESGHCELMPLALPLLSGEHPKVHSDEDVSI